MPLYTYSAAEKNGNIIDGERDAENSKTLAETLKKEGLFLLKIKSGGKEKVPALSAINDMGAFFSRFRRITIVDKMFFARNLMVMVSAGLSLTKALDGLADETPNRRFQQVIRDVHDSVTKGKSFAESLRLHEKVFGDLFINMIEVGETTGKLTLVLKLIANQMKKDSELRKRVTGAMMYPAIIIAALIIIGALMMIYVVPNLSQTLLALGVTLPPTTLFVIWLSDMLVNYLPYALLVAALVIFGVWKLLQLKSVKQRVDKIILRLPVFGVLSMKLNVARFCRTLSYLTTSGVPIMRSLEITSNVLGNSVYKKLVMAAVPEVQRGKALHQIFKESPRLFPPVVTQMIEVGEETGKVSDMLLRLAVFYEADVSNTTKNLSTIIEPILMVFIGAAVAFFAVSMLQPIYSSMGNI